jgi:hypothetical protein
MRELENDTNRAPKSKGIPTTKIILTIVVIAVVAASTALYYNYYSLLGSTSSQDAATDTTASNPNTIRRGPAPKPLIDSHGPAFQLNQAKTLTGFELASLPSELPAGLDLSSVRVRTSTDVEANLMTAFYTPPGVKADNTDTFESVMAGGGIAIIYAHEPTSPAYDQEKWIAAFVEDAPDVRRLETINGNPTIAVTGNPDKGLTYQVFLYKANMQINLVSLKFTDTELLKIASSIA